MHAAPVTTAGYARRSKGTPRAIQPPDRLGPDGKQLRKLWHVRVFGPFLVGASTSGGWRVRDTRTDLDEVVGDMARSLARAFA